MSYELAIKITVITNTFNSFLYFQELPLFLCVNTKNIFSCKIIIYVK